MPLRLLAAILSRIRSPVNATGSPRERAAKQFEASEALGTDYVWNAYLRVADRIDRSFRD